MVRPTGVRSLAGFTLGERLGQDIYGEIHRASGEGRKDLRLLVVEPRLAADQDFGDALGRGTKPLGTFHHRAVVDTVIVARDGKRLVVVTEGTVGASTLADVLARGGKTVPRVAAAIARSVIDALATAHAAGIVHGAVHPRSILVDRGGAVRLTDFAVGFAAMSAAAAGSDAMSLRGLAGYVAPELALGDPPTPACDVYAAGALLFTMLAGAAPPGSLHTTPAIERLVQRAIDTELGRRFADAVELQESFLEALEDDRWDVATPDEVARCATEAEQTLDAATEDLLASLERSEVTRLPAAARAASSSSVGIDSILSELDEDASTDGPHTVVDGRPGGQVARDPISELLELDADARTNVVDPDGRRPLGPDEPGDPDHTPLPPPQPDEPGTLTRAGSAPRPIRRSGLIPQPSRLVEATRRKGDAGRRAPSPEVEATLAPPPAAVVAPVVAFGTEPATVPRAVQRAALPVEELATVEPPRLSRSPVWTWIGLLVVAAGAAVLVFQLQRQGDDRREVRRLEAKDRDQKAEAAAELERRLRVEQADPGAIAVQSTPDGAAVWLLLGRTPFDSIALSTESVWELRVELEGYAPQDVRVGGAGWSGAKDARRAAIELTLAPGTPARPLPAMPAEPPPTDRAGLAEGSGTLHAVTTPPGAAVWLLVGQTNKMSLTGIEAGRDYELKVAKDGFLPGFARVAAEEWRAGGDPRLPLAAAPKHATIERSVELVPRPAPGR